jgi:hypothetical protein
MIPLKLYANGEHNGFELRKKDDVYILVKARYKSNRDATWIERKDPDTLKEWKHIPNQDEVNHEIMLNDWSRWNEELPRDQVVEISEAIYDDLLGCLPPHVMQGNYFEVGEPHHHDNNGRPVHRACWMENGKFYTGYPKTNKQ